MARVHSIIHLSSTEGIRLARVCNRERTRQYPGLPGFRGRRSPSSAPGPGAPASPASSLVLPHAAPAPFPRRDPPASPSACTPSSSRRGMLRVWEGWRRGRRAGGSAYWLCACPRDPAAVTVTVKSKAFQRLRAEKSLFPGPRQVSLSNLTMWQRIPPDTSRFPPAWGWILLPVPQ